MPPTQTRGKKTSTDSSDLQATEIEVNVLASINKKLDLLVTLHNEIRDLRSSLEFAHNHIKKLEQSNNSLQSIVKIMCGPGHKRKQDNERNYISLTNKKQNLIFSSMPEHLPDNPEPLIKEFVKIQLKPPPDPVNQITAFTISDHVSTKHPD